MNWKQRPAWLASFAAIALFAVLVPALFAGGEERAPDPTNDFAFVLCQNRCGAIAGAPPQSNCICTSGVGVCQIETPYATDMAGNCIGPRCMDSNGLSCP